MKRIIAQATLVALIATTVAPIAQANWAVQGFKNFGHKAVNHNGFSNFLLTFLVPGILAMGYERYSTRRAHAPSPRELYDKSKKDLIAMGAFSDVLGREDRECAANRGDHLNVKALKKSFSTLAQVDQEKLKELFATYISNPNVTKNFTELLDKVNTISSERNRIHEQMYLIDGKRIPPCEDSGPVVATGKLMGAIGILGAAAMLGGCLGDAWKQSRPSIKI